MGNLFDTRSHAWKEAGLEAEIKERSTQRRARRETLVLVPVLIAVLVLFSQRGDIFPTADDGLVRAVTVVLLVIVGWWIARDIGRLAGPALMRRMDPAMAGTVGFVIRLAVLAVVVLAALWIATVSPAALVAGGAFTAVVLGLAAQQTLGNLIAGTVLLSARPFSVGDRVRLQGGSIGGRIEGVVSSLGLLYTSFSSGEERVLVPNSVVLGVTVTPLREPDSVSLRATLRAGITPAEVEHRIIATVETPLRSRPHVTLVELTGEEVVMQIEATPLKPADGSQLAGELLAAVSEETTS
jgi:small-conductance mechanosensitive channel